MAVLHVTSENFESEVLKADGKVLVDFWATWCGPCQMLALVIEELAEELTDVKVCKIDVDEERSLALKYKVMSIPTLVVFDKGEIVRKSVGFSSKEEILELLK
ncbi:MAG: thioredoxin [Lachnospiraceae bacterium]|nr:thioredoxin [Lachnospiraceae bacterium]